MSAHLSLLRAKRMFLQRAFTCSQMTARQDADTERLHEAEAQRQCHGERELQPAQVGLRRGALSRGTPFAGPRALR
jgi:hypothetical protein